MLHWATCQRIREGFRILVKEPTLEAEQKLKKEQF